MVCRTSILRLVCLATVTLFVQMSCAGSGDGLYIKCWLEDTGTGKRVPARFEISGVSSSTGSTCIDRKGKGCTFEVGALADYEVSCLPLGDYKVIGLERQNAFPGHSVVFFCTEPPL